MAPDTKKAMNRLIASAFNNSTEAEKDAAVRDAMDKLRRDREAGPDDQGQPPDAAA
jgi:hypothetical protein